MTFDEILDRAIEMLRRRKRLSYRALKRQFDLDDDYLDSIGKFIFWSSKALMNQG